MQNFICGSCGKTLKLENRIFEKAYKDQEFCLDCRSSHGGKREGAGRPSLGTTKKVSITLPDEIWTQIEEAKGDQSLSAFLRNVIVNGNWI